MKVQTGYLYHIKDDFFNKVNDENLMSNHELGRKRPSYFVIKDKEILWFIPLSSKVEKYQRIIDKKIKSSFALYFFWPIEKKKNILYNKIKNVK